VKIFQTRVGGYSEINRSRTAPRYRRGRLLAALLRPVHTILPISCLTRAHERKRRVKWRFVSNICFVLFSNASLLFPITFYRDAISTKRSNTFVKQILRPTERVRRVFLSPPPRAEWRGGRPARSVRTVVEVGRCASGR